MKFEFVPWPNFADRMLNELNSKGKLCDLIIGDSQWIGGSAESGHYVKLNDFFAKEGIKISDFAPATVTGYAEWPKGTPNYWALPAMGDALGWTYRKDWFAKPELQAEFKKKHNRDLARRRPGPSSSRWPSSSRARRSTARRSTARTSSPSAAPKASRWA
jgi:multiple sugar transport system substrate-binding protein